MLEALGAFWGSIVGAFAQVLAFMHDLFAGFTDPESMAWGLAIIALTVVIQIILLPLAVKQFHSMRAMQELQPKIKKIQEKYDTDRSLLKKDPERYKDQRQKMNEEMMALYREEGVNPASGCLPLILQAPIFIALFDVLQSPDIAVIEGLQNATFLFLPALGTATSGAGLAGWLMIGLMVATMFVVQRQMMASRSGDSTGTQQKIMLFGMPVFLAFVAQRLPLGVLVYWVTRNILQFGQQSVILRGIDDEEEDEADDDSTGSNGSSSKRSTDGKQQAGGGSGNGRRGAETASGNGSKQRPDGGGTSGSSRRRKGHTPSRRSS